MAWTTPATATAGSTALTAAFWNEQVRDQFIELAPAANAWTSWTPTWSSVTVGNAQNVGRYMQVGKTVIAQQVLTLGSTSSVGGDILCSLPVARNTSVLNEVTGVGFMVDASLSAVYQTILLVSGQSAYHRAASANTTYVQATPCSATVPFTWAVSDVIRSTFIYEAS